MFIFLSEKIYVRIKCNTTENTLLYCKQISAAGAKSLQTSTYGYLSAVLKAETVKGCSNTNITLISVPILRVSVLVNYVSMTDIPEE